MRKLKSNSVGMIKHSSMEYQVPARAPFLTGFFGRSTEKGGLITDHWLEKVPKKDLYVWSSREKTSKRVRKIQLSSQEVQQRLGSMFWKLRFKNLMVTEQRSHYPVYVKSKTGSIKILSEHPISFSPIVSPTYKEMREALCPNQQQKERNFSLK